MLTGLFDKSENKETNETQNSLSLYQDQKNTNSSDKLQNVKPENIYELQYQITKETLSVYSDINQAASCRPLFYE